MGPRNAVLGVADACGPPYLDLRWGSLWGYETLSWAWRTHAAPPTWTFGGAPYGATKRVRGVPRAEARRGRREEGEEEGGGEETRGTVSSKRGRNTTGWLGKNGFQVLAKLVW